MKIPALFAGVPISYIAAALLFGLIATFGISAMTYHPLPMQVQINQYAPIKPPSPAIPTIVPAKPANPDTPFAPAPPPQIITTQDLPTIKPVKPQQTYRCDVDESSPSNAAVCIMQNMVPLVNAAVGLVPLMISLIILPLVLGVFGQMEKMLDPRR
jgi:hypothetical protein